MARPRLEHGYTRIANELLEALAEFNFTKREYKIVLVVLRETYGYNEKRRRISVDKMASFSGLDRGNVSRTLTVLVRAGVLLKQQHENGAAYGLNKDYNSWIREPTQGLPKRQQNVAKTTTNGLPKQQQTDSHSLLIKDKEKDTLKTLCANDPCTGFEKWWEIYPIKKSKIAAKKIWERRGLDTMVEMLITDAKLRMQKDRDWLRGAIPHPTTYLNGDRWTDQIDERPNGLQNPPRRSRVDEFEAANGGPGYEPD